MPSWGTRKRIRRAIERKALDALLAVSTRVIERRLVVVRGRTHVEKAHGNMTVLGEQS
jgi:hypothetical protein